MSEVQIAGEPITNSSIASSASDDRGYPITHRAIDRGITSSETIIQIMSNEDNRIKILSGICGRFLGYGQSVANNIASIAIVLLLFIAGIYSLFPQIRTDGLAIKDLWLCITPLLTLCFGSLFGSRSDNKNK